MMVCTHTVASHLDHSEDQLIAGGAHRAEFPGRFDESPLRLYASPEVTLDQNPLGTFPLHRTAA